MALELTLPQEAMLSEISSAYWCQCQHKAQKRAHTKYKAAAGMQCSYMVTENTRTVLSYCTRQLSKQLVRISL